MTDHAKLSPSSAGRWMKCQTSLLPIHENDVLRRTDDDLKFAKDGSAKHELADWCLRNECDPTDALLGEMTFYGVPVTVEMVQQVSIYVEYIRRLRTEIDDPVAHQFFEDRVYMSEISDDMFGTLDYALFSEKHKHLYIGDAKFGHSLQKAEGNWQLRAYAIGKTQELEDAGHVVDTITCFICQPPDVDNPVKTVHYQRQELVEFAKQLKRASKGNKTEAGTHCTYCPRAHICPTLESYVVEHTKGAGDADLTEQITRKTSQELADILNSEEVVTVYFKAIKAWAKQRIIMGDTVTGWKISQGQSNRKYKDETDAENRLHKIFGDSIYKQSLRSPSQIEKLFGKKTVDELLGDLTYRELTTQQLKRG